MSAYTVLALLQAAAGRNALHSGGWSVILWFWVILGAVALILFFALTFRRRDLPHDEPRRDESPPLERHDREVYP